ncbi:MAG: hypothetical protein QM730_18470 [Anaerolineales bacterium]
MNRTIFPIHQPESVRPPMVYIKERTQWEYKQIVRDLKKEQPLSEEELNALGKDGWEMSGISQHSNKSYFYFKRLAER